ncbi:hypothetical protein GWK48_08050 [Metallosphaera tengchongensis]|uniref:Uncharacterized protein n=1 Tax=Metallosphaera tengchongensis TaxID=1532350 RepID=A0A6N0NTX4_9CREN|nr:hypothetical protein GWK48_08050 [Metallosphaera tengchongensis]
MEIFEGFMVVHKGVTWSVKGCYHPEGFAVAMPRYVDGRKIKTLKEGLEFVRSRFPEYLKLVKEIGFQVPLVPLKESVVLNPFLVSLEGTVNKFKSLFKNTGVTGSYLYLGKGHDMDLVSTDVGNVEILKELRRKGVTSPLEEVNETELESLPKEDFQQLKRRRITEGIFMGVPYTFKIVECESFGEVTKVENFKDTVKIIRVTKPYSLPVKYYTDVGVTITSFRTRFTELPPGTKLRVKGLLLHRDFLDLDLDLAEEVRIVQLGGADPAS